MATRDRAENSVSLRQPESLFSSVLQGLFQNAHGNKKKNKNTKLTLFLIPAFFKREIEHLLVDMDKLVLFLISPRGEIEIVLCVLSSMCACKLAHL